MSAMLGNVLQPLSLPPQRASYHVYPSLILSKGQSLYRAGDEADSIYRVEEGLLKQSVDLQSGRERIMSLMGPGDFAGAITYSQDDYAENVTALSPNVRVTVIPADHLELDGSLKSDVFTATGLQLRRALEALEDSELPMPARLARTLLRLGSRFGQTTEGGRVLLRLPLTHDHLAAMIGAARETTTATLGEMRALGILTGTRGQYSFDPERLQDFALERALV